MKNDRLNIKEQCELLEINRTSMYYQPVEPAEKALEREEYIKSRIDYWHTKFCYIGHRKIKEKLVPDSVDMSDCDFWYEIGRASCRERV